MRSLIKQHKKDSSGSGFHHEPPPTERGLPPQPPFAGESMVSAQSSPVRTLGSSSPTSNKGKKLKRLFYRTKTSSPILNSYPTNVFPVSPKKSPPPSIRGTRTHEWGISPSNIPKRSSLNSTHSAAHSLSSGSEFTSSQSLKRPCDDRRTSEDSGDILPHIEIIQLPLNTVLEQPVSNNNLTSEAEIKNAHRRAQIITTDSPRLDDAAEIIPGLFRRVEYSDEEDEIDPNETEVYGILGDKEEGKGESEEKEEEELRKKGARNSQEIREVQEAHEAQEVHEAHEAHEAQETQEVEATEEADEGSFSDGSEFSFEQNNITGRNTSIRYYKSINELEAKPPPTTVRQQGYYVNDFVDDDFDDDMNYFDEDDDGFNDDEELFNRKYFDDDDDDHGAGHDDHNPQNNYNNQNNYSNQNNFNNNNEKKDNQSTRSSNLSSASMRQEPSYADSPLGMLHPSRSLKYHELPKSLDQEFSAKRYSWFSDEENDHGEDENGGYRENSFDEEDFLDEINTIPENYDFPDPDEEIGLTGLSKSKSLNSQKIKRVVRENSQQKNKIVTNSKTVTLFSNNNYNNGSSNNNNNYLNTFGYSTPNSSFTSPNPKFMSDQGNQDLSPISEGSFDSSP